ncbi:MAG: hypothetical protein AABX50_02115 [Nanoarchaeota archaeon]
MVIIKCKNCGKESEHQAKGMCITCYKKLAWKPKRSICKRCGREMFLHAKGYCPGCYNFIFHLKKNREITYRKYHNIDPETYYKRLSNGCIICGFRDVLDLHHLDGNKQNNSENNLIALCPNHHRMLHHTDFKEEVTQELKNKGFMIKEQRAHYHPIYNPNR